MRCVSERRRRTQIKPQSPPQPQATRTNLAPFLSADFRICLLLFLFLFLFLWPLGTSELPAVASPSHYVQARSLCELDEAGGLDGHMGVEMIQARGPQRCSLSAPPVSLLPAPSASDETSPAT